MLVASEIKAIMHNIQASGMKPDLPLVVFVKSLYPTHSNYLESLQASDKFKSLTFDTLVEKITDREKEFGKKTTEHSRESLCFAQKAKNRTKDQSKDHTKGESSKRGRGRRNFRGRGAETTSTKDQICSESVVERLGTHQISVGLHGTPSNTSITRRKMIIKIKMLVNLLILLIVLLHIVILELMK